MGSGTMTKKISGHLFFTHSHPSDLYIKKSISITWLLRSAIFPGLSDWTNHKRFKSLTFMYMRKESFFQGEPKIAERFSCREQYVASRFRWQWKKKPVSISYFPVLDPSGEASFLPQTKMTYIGPRTISGSGHTAIPSFEKNKRPSGFAPDYAIRNKFHVFSGNEFCVTWGILCSTSFHL
jgi:hypothetical protein